MCQNMSNVYYKAEALQSMLEGEYSEESTGARTIRQSGGAGPGRDRHSKVLTARGARDRRVRLSVSTAIRFYDLQDRLGLDQPSKAVDWLLGQAKPAIDSLPGLRQLINAGSPNLIHHWSASHGRHPAIGAHHADCRSNVTTASPSSASNSTGPDQNVLDAVPRSSKRLKPDHRDVSIHDEINNDGQHEDEDGDEQLHLGAAASTSRSLPVGVPHDPAQRPIAPRQSILMDAWLSAQARKLKAELLDGPAPDHHHHHHHLLYSNPATHDTPCSTSMSTSSSRHLYPTDMVDAAHLIHQNPSANFCAHRTPPVANSTITDADRINTTSSNYITIRSPRLSTSDCTTLTSKSATCIPSANQNYWANIPSSTTITSSIYNQHHDAATTNNVNNIPYTRINPQYNSNGLLSSDTDNNNNYPKFSNTRAQYNYRPASISSILMSAKSGSPDHHHHHHHLYHDPVPNYDDQLQPPTSITANNCMFSMTSHDPKVSIVQQSAGRIISSGEFAQEHKKELHDQQLPQFGERISPSSTTTNNNIHEHQKADPRLGIRWPHQNGKVSQSGKCEIDGSGQSGLGLCRPRDSSPAASNTSPTNLAENGSPTNLGAPTPPPPNLGEVLNHPKVNMNTSLYHAIHQQYPL